LDVNNISWECIQTTVWNAKFFDVTI
jgi:hypothetical protein